MKIKVGIVNLSFGNILSVIEAVRYFNIEPKIIKNPTDILHIDKLIIPGVGSYVEAMKQLNCSQMTTAIHEFNNSGRLIFGICLGMQLFFQRSYEFVTTDGLGFLQGDVIPLRTKVSDRTKVPHIGWSQLNFPGIKTGGWQTEKCLHAYFIHSFFVPISKDNTLNDITCTFHDVEFIAGLRRENIFGTQFHPEKSGLRGLSFYREFLYA